MKFVPLRVPHLLTAARLVSPDQLTEISFPTTAPSGLAPYEAGSHALLGSTLRFSQPLSGFLADPNFVALFRATAVHGIPPPESSPRRNRRPLSRSPLLPGGHSPTCRYAVSRSLSPPVSPTSTLTRGCLVPPTTMSSLFTLPKERFPVTLGPSDETISFRQLHPLRSFNPPASPFAPTRVAPHQRSILSWVYAFLKPSPSTPWILDPPRPRGSEHGPLSEDSGSRLEGPCNPSRRVKPSLIQKHRGQLRRQIPIPFETGLHRHSAALLLPWPWHSGQALRP